MRTLLLSLACAAAVFTATAQDCVISQFDFDATLNPKWVCVDVAPDGGMVGVVVQDPDLGDFIVVRVDGQGDLVWSKRIVTTDPLKELFPSTIGVSPDGGAVIFGRTRIRTTGPTIGGYANYFGIRVGPLGEVLWARYYARHVPVPEHYLRFIDGEVLPNGDCLLAMPTSTGLCMMRLDEMGVPYRTDRYEILPSPAPFDLNGVFGLHVEATGYVNVAGTLDHRSFVMRTHEDGQVEWAAHYSDGQGHARMIALLASGDHLVCGSSSSWHDPVFGWGYAMRVGPTGVPIWKHRYYEAPLIDATELSNGELLFAHAPNTPFVALRASSAGIPVAGSAPGALQNVLLAGLIGDTVLMTGTTGSPGMQYPVMGKMTSAYELDCAFPDADSPSGTGSLPNILSSTVTVEEDSMKTWTMSLLQPAEFAQRDLYAQLTSGVARPGFQMMYAASANNAFGLWSGPVEAQLIVDPQLTFVSAEPPPTAVAGNTLSWELPAMGGFSQQMVTATFQVPPSAVLGSSLTASFAVVQDSAEIDLTNNTAYHARTLVGSYDPNDKSVTPEIYSLVQDSVLQYVVRFQNTGTDTAFTVVIRDTLPSSVHAHTLIPGPASHPYTYSLSGNGALVFTFTNILLPDSNTNEPLSHGFVAFQVKPNEEVLAPGMTIDNAADIFFDFNAPIHTNTATVLVDPTTGLDVLATISVLSVFPVPARDQLTVVMASGLARSWTIRAVDGRRILGSSIIPSARPDIPLRGLSAGAYLLTVEDTNGRSSTIRFTKE